MWQLEKVAQTEPLSYLAHTTKYGRIKGEVINCLLL